MGLIIIPLFLLNAIFFILLCVHIFTMQSLNSTSWQSAMLWGGGISLVFALPFIFFKSSQTGAGKAQEEGENIINFMFILILLSILVFILSFFPTSWYWFHFIKAVLAAIAVCSPLLMIIMSILFEVVRFFQKK